MFRSLDRNQINMEKHINDSVGKSSLDAKASKMLNSELALITQYSFIYTYILLM